MNSGIKHSKKYHPRYEQYINCYHKHHIKQRLTMYLKTIFRHSLRTFLISKYEKQSYTNIGFIGNVWHE